MIRLICGKSISSEHTKADTRNSACGGMVLTGRYAGPAKKRTRGCTTFIFAALERKCVGFDLGRNWLCFAATGRPATVHSSRTTAALTSTRFEWFISIEAKDLKRESVTYASNRYIPTYSPSADNFQS